MNSTRLVYSTDGNNQCPRCHKALRKCSCKEQLPEPKNCNGIRLSLDKKGRKQAGVTVIDGLELERDDLKKLAKRLKVFCGSGGTLKGNRIEIQGDHRRKLQQYLATDYTKVTIIGAD